MVEQLILDMDKAKNVITTLSVKDNYFLSHIARLEKTVDVLEGRSLYLERELDNIRGRCNSCK